MAKTKKKLTPAAAQAALAKILDPRVAIIDELGKLEAELAAIAPSLKRRDALKKLIREWPAADKLDPQACPVYRGATYMAVLGPAENERTIASMTAVQEKLGPEWLLANCSVTLKKLEAALPAGIDELVSEARTGSRTLTLARAA